MTIKIKELNLVDRLDAIGDQNLTQLLAETVKSIEGWRVLEKQMEQYVTIEGGFQSNRLYTVFFLAKTESAANIPFDAIMHQDLIVDHQMFTAEGLHYVMIKVAGYNKIAIDHALDQMRSFKNNDDIKYIRSKINIIMQQDSYALRSLIDFIEYRFIFE